MQNVIKGGLVVLLLATSAATQPRGAPQTSVKVVLVGDSTVTDRTGWGRGFRRLVGDSVEVVNLAAGGRSSKSYLAEGRWKEALAAKGDVYLIQFGHNDEPGKGPDRETDPRTTFRENMKRYVDDVRAIGAQPVLITSLTRRNFKDGRIHNTLTPYVEAVRAVATEKRVPLIDLYVHSIALTEQMGNAAWDAISPRDAAGAIDRTHLTAEGSDLIAPLVVRELKKLVPKLAPHLLDQPLSGAAKTLRIANAVVAADGSGQYRTVQEAINAAPQNTTVDRPWVIFVKAGTYREIVYVQREKRFVSLVGEDPATTVITYNLHANLIGADGKPIGTFRTPTVSIDADDFSAENLTVENTAGPVGQALALRVDGDRVVFRNSRFLGWQDTIFLNRGRHYFEDAFIAGHVDFIFGGATAFFERCHIHALRNGYITAASTPAEQRHGFVFANGRLTGADGVKTYLGRPWRDYAHTTFVDTEMSDVIRAEGWHNWDKPEREKTSRYSEARNRGAGATTAGRVTWTKPLTDRDIEDLTPGNVLRGTDGWDPSRVPPHPSEGQAVAAPPPAADPAPAPRVIALWPEGVPDGRPDGGEERIVDGRVTNVHVPTLTFYPAPKSLANGTAIIVAPGGGYQRLAVEKEGTAFTRRWNDLGVSAFVLKYRLSEYGHPAPLRDVLRAVRVVRSRAAEFGVDPSRIGIFGSSAGGHLAATAATLYDHADGRTGHALDRISARPDFIGLLYPVITMDGPFVHAASRRNLIGEKPPAELIERVSAEKHVTEGTPPVFLVHTAEDASVPVEHSLAFYASLRRAGVPVELHLYEKGPHGFGAAAGYGTASDWPRRFEEWLQARGFLNR